MRLEINPAADAGASGCWPAAKESSGAGRASAGSFGKEISLLRCCQCLELLLGAVKHVLRFAFLFNIRHFVWLLLLLALFLLIIFDFLLLPYQLRLLFSVKLGISFLKQKKKLKGSSFLPC